MDVDWATVVGKAGIVRFLKREEDAPKTLDDFRLGKDALPQYYCRYVMPSLASFLEHALHSWYT
jgi:hypothetical protein